VFSTAPRDFPLTPNSVPVALFLCLLLLWTCGPAQTADRETQGSEPPILSAAEIDYPPFSVADAQGRAGGFAVELLRAALRAMGRDVVFRVGTWQEVRGLLEKGEVRALPLVGRNPEREPFFDFTFPYMTLRGAIVVRSGNSDIHNLDDLKGRTVAVMEGDNAEEYLRREDRGIRIFTTPTFEDALFQLSGGLHDAVVIQGIVAARLLQETGLPNLRMIKTPIKGFRQDFCFAVKEGDSETLALLNEGLALIMADGTYRHLHAKWFAALELPTNRRIVVGGDHNYPPFEFLDEDGKPAGYNVDLTRAIAKILGLDIEIRLGPWAFVRDALARGEIDALQGMFYSPERDLVFDFTPPHCVNHCVGVVRKGEGPPPSTPDDLGDKQIVVQRGDIMHDFAVKNGLADRLSVVDAPEDALRALSKGEYDCALVSRLTALYWIKKRGLRNLIVGTRPFLSPDYCYAVPNNHKALLAQFTEGLRLLEESGEFRKIQKKWMGVYEDAPADLSQILKYMVLAVLLLLPVFVAAFAWSWSLRKQVANRTKALHENERLLAAIIDAIAVPVFYKNEHGVYMGCNQAFSGLLQLSKKDIIGKTVFGVFPTESAHRYSDDESKLLKEGNVQIHEEDVPDSKGDKHRVVFHKAVFRGPDGGIKGIVGALLDITELKHAQAALEESERKYRLLADNTLDVIWVMSPGLEFTYVNPACFTLTGYQPEEWIGTRLSDHCDEENFRRMARIIADHLALGSKSSGVIFEAVMLKKDGEPIPVEIHSKLIYGDNDQLLHLQGITRDITERKRAEEALKRRRTMLSRTEAIAHIGSWEWDVPTDTVTWSDELFRIFQRDPTEGAPSFAQHVGLHPPEDFARLAEAVESTLNDRTPYQVELRAIRSNGTTRHCLARGYPEDNDGKPITRLYGSLQDITEFKLAQDRIEHLNKVLQAIRDVNQLIVRERDRDTLIREACRLLVDHRGYMSAMIILTDGDDRPVFWAEAGMKDSSEALDDMFQRGDIPPCCELARSVDEVVSMSEHNAGCRRCPIAASCPSSNSMCMRLINDGAQFGYFSVILEDGPVADAEERGLFAETAGDIAYALRVLQTDAAHREIEREHRSLQNRMLQAQKMESVGRLAGGVAHDYNNMLNVIIGYAELAMDKLGPDDPLYADLKEILNAAGRSAQITRQLLAFARKQTINPKVLDLNETVEGMLKMLRRLIGEDIDLAWLPKARSWRVKMDPAQIDQILANLCVNARDAIDGVGKITIETDNVAFDETYCEDHEGYLPGDFVLLAVADDGCGMDEETLNGVFEPFFTTKESSRGTGLGLATVYGIVNQNKGFINVYSEPGRGTIFRLYLPRHEGEVEDHRPAPPGELPTSRGETVLLVEDEPGIMKMGRMMLEKLGYRVLAAPTPSEAVRLAKEQPDGIDLLITDVVMPEMNGRELADFVQSLHPRIKILFMSGYTANVIAHRGVLDEGVNFMQKPFSLHDLAGDVRKALGGD
jgi:PAS domain S-box-containing protein